MKVADLRRALEGIDDTLTVVAAYGDDHSYPIVFYAQETDAEYVGGGEYFEYYDDANMFPDGKKVRVFRIG